MKDNTHISCNTDLRLNEAEFFMGVSFLLIKQAESSRLLLESATEI